MANEVVLRETRTPSMIVGCDPGKSGALARLDHAAPDSHNPSQCNNRRFVRSGSFNEAVLLHREHVEPTLFEGEGAA